MLKYLIICVFMLVAPGLATAKAPAKCAKGDKACEKKKAKEKKSPKNAKKADKKAGKKAAKVAKKDAKKNAKKPTKTAAKKPDKKPKKKVEEAMMPPFNDTGEPAPDSITPPGSSMDAPTTAAAPTPVKGDMGDDIFPEASGGSSAPSDPAASSAVPDGIGSDADFDLGDELPAE